MGYSFLCHEGAKEDKMPVRNKVASNSDFREREDKRFLSLPPYRSSHRSESAVGFAFTFPTCPNVLFAAGLFLTDVVRKGMR